MNLLKETKEVLQENGKTLNDIKWIGSYAFKIDKEVALEIFKKTNYDEGYGAQEVATDLLVVGDNWWLERHEYDGSEWWEYKEMPNIPKEEKFIERVAGGMWCTLDELIEAVD